MCAEITLIHDVMWRMFFYDVRANCLPHFETQNCLQIRSKVKQITSYLNRVLLTSLQSVREAPL